MVERKYIIEKKREFFRWQEELPLVYLSMQERLQATNPIYSVLRTSQKYICISCPRRFGKSITANMFAAYYGCENDSKEVFSKFKIVESKSL